MYIHQSQNAAPVVHSASLLILDFSGPLTPRSWRIRSHNSNLRGFVHHHQPPVEELKADQYAALREGEARYPVRGAQEIQLLREARLLPEGLLDVWCGDLLLEGFNCKHILS